MKKDTKFEINLLNGPILKNILIFSIPLFVSYLFQSLYNTADTAIVGHTLGTQSLAAVGSVSSLFELLTGFALGVGNGLSIVTARAFGSGDENMIKKSVFGSIVIGLGVSILLSILSCLALRPLMRLIRVPENLFQEAWQYIFTIGLFIFVMFAYNLCAGLLRAIGNSFIPLLFLIFSSVLNILLDLLFIVRFEMGVTGAAAATVLAQAVSALLCVIYIVKKARILVPKREHLSVGIPLYRELLGQGFSMAFMLAIVNIGTVILSSGINGLNDADILAGHTAARKLFFFTSMPFLSISLAVATFVSQNKGAGNIDRIRRCMKETYIVHIAMALVISLLMFLFARPLVALVTGSDNESILQNGALYLKVAAPNYAVLGILLETRNALQGLGAKWTPLISSLIECGLKYVFVIALIPRFQYMAVIFCEPVIWNIMMVQLLFSFWRNINRDGSVRKNQKR